MPKYILHSTWDQLKDCMFSFEISSQLLDVDSA